MSTRRRRIAGLASLCALSAAAPAEAATTFGADLNASPPVAATSTYSVTNVDAPGPGTGQTGAPMRGVLVSVRVRTRGAAGEGLVRVLREVADSDDDPSTYRFNNMGDSLVPLRADTTDEGHITEVVTRVRIEVGDRLGWYSNDPGNGVQSTYHDPTAECAFTSESHSPGSPVTYSTAYCQNYVVLVAGTIEADADGDGFGDESQDSDDDNDGVPDSSDALPLNASESGDTDRDGTGDNADADDDNDGVPDSSDAFPKDASRSLPEGSSAADTLNGNALDNTICGLGGNDTINGLQGNDTLFGDACNDKQRIGGAQVADGNDVLSGSEGNDTLYGAGGRDKLDGGIGNDRLFGGGGNDSLHGAAGNDKLVGDSGNDTLNGGAGKDGLDGGAGNDKLNGGGAKNSYRGGAGRDTIAAANGQKETVDCGAGRDTARVDKTDKVKGCETVKRAK